VDHVNNASLLDQVNIPAYVVENLTDAELAAMKEALVTQQPLVRDEPEHPQLQVLQGGLDPSKLPKTSVEFEDFAWECRQAEAPVSLHALVEVGAFGEDDYFVVQGPTYCVVYLKFDDGLFMAMMSNQGEIWATVPKGAPEDVKPRCLFQPIVYEMARVKKALNEQRLRTWRVGKGAHKGIGEGDAYQRAEKLFSTPMGNLMWQPPQTEAEEAAAVQAVNAAREAEIFGKDTVDRVVSELAGG
jgi:hypothetical protein